MRPTWNLIVTGSLGILLLSAERLPACDRPSQKLRCLKATSEIQRQLVLLQTCPNWRVRDDAAHDLRSYHWQCHPEIVFGLLGALQTDGHEEVREEAAESLAKLAPCVDGVEATLQVAAVHDPDHATRKWARRGLDRLDRHGQADSRVCGSTPTPTAFRGRPRPVASFLTLPETMILSPGMPATPSMIEPVAPSLGPAPFEPELDLPWQETPGTPVPAPPLPTLPVPGAVEVLPPTAPPSTIAPSPFSSGAVREGRASEIRPVRGGVGRVVLFSSQQR